MDLKQLRAFLAVVEAGTVTRAADVLNLVQPAVSRQIRLLEDDIGSPLFDRERQGMVLTAAGQALEGYARRALLELERGRAEVMNTTTGELGGLVTLGLLPSTVDILSSPLVGLMAERFPGIRLRIAVGYAGTLLQWLASGEVDAALLYGAEHSPNIRSMALIEEALWAIGPPGSELRADRPVTLEELTRQKLVLPSAPHGIRTLLEHACAVQGVTFDVAVETNALSVQRSLVLGGHGLTILPPIAVAPDLASGQLAGAPFAAPGISRTIVLSVPTNRSTARHVQCAIDVLMQVAEQAIRGGAWPEGKWIATP